MRRAVAAILRAALIWGFMMLVPLGTPAALAQPGPADGSTAPAFPLVVRGGEHPGFTRLTLQAEAALRWSLRPRDGTTLLLVEGTAGPVDLSRAFERIGRERVADIRSVPPPPGADLALQLEIADGRTIVAFEDRPGLLVIDVRDRPGAAAPAADPAAPVRTVGAAPPPVRDAPGGASAPPAAGSGHGPPAPPPVPSGAAAAWMRLHLDPVPDIAPPASPAEDEVAVDPPVDRTRAYLAEKLARAASQAAIHVGPPPADTGAARPAGPVASGMPAAGPPAFGLSVETAVDREVGRAAASRLAAAVHCVDAALLDPAAWRDPVSDWEGIVVARSAIAGELDKPRPGAVAALARAYLSVGLGAEAAAVIAAFPGEVPGDEMLRVLAAVIDGAAAPDSGLARMQACPGTTAIWAVLAAGAVPGRDALDRPALVMAFASMPRNLRRLIGPRLAKLFLDAGEPALAATLHEIARRGSDADDPPAILFEAMMAMDAGDPTTAIALLRPLAGTLLPEGPEAALLLVEAHALGGHPVPAALREVLAVLAVEWRGSEIAPRVAAARALAEASAGDFGAAGAHRAELGDALPEAAAATLDHRLTGLLAETAGDAEFLRHVLAASGWRGGTAPPELRLALGRRFLDLGLPELALSALSPEARAPGPERVMRARARLAVGDAAGALRGLEQVELPEAAALRADALLALGDVAAAAAALVAAGDTAAAAALAWRSGNAELIRRHGTAAQRAALVAAEAPGAAPGAPPAPEPVPGDAAPMDEAQPGPIGAARGLLASGAGVRDDVAALLRDHPAPPPGRAAGPAASGIAEP